MTIVQVLRYNDLLLEHVGNVVVWPIHPITMGAANCGCSRL